MRDGVGETHPPLAAGSGFAGDLAGVRHRHQVVGDHEGDREDGLERRLVPARERLAGVGGLHLGRGDRPVLAVVVGEGRPVEAHQLVVQHARELDLDHGVADGEGLGQPEGDPFGVVVGRRGGVVARATGDHRGRGDGELEPVHHDLGHRVDDLDGDRDPSDKGGGVEIGLEFEVVATRDHGPRESMRVVLHPSNLSAPI